MNTQDLTKDTKGEIVIYQSEEGKAVIDVILQDETVWVTQEQMVALFGKAKSTISEHLKHIFEEGELDQNSVVRFFRTTAADGKSYIRRKRFYKPPTSARKSRARIHHLSSARDEPIRI